MLKLNGIFAPIPTSFNTDESLATDKIRDNLNRLCRYDLAGFLALGSNGENVMLTESEKFSVFETAREAIPENKLMLAGTGGQSTAETVRLSRKAAEIGADAVVVLHPFYYKRLMTPRALTAFYRAVADACPVPVVVYNMPACSGIDMDAATIAEISTHPNIVGIKDSGGNVTKMGDVVSRSEEGFQVLAGSAGFLLPTLSIGGVGGICALANVAPKRCLEVYQSYRNGDMDKAAEIQRSIIPLNTAVTSGGGVPALKAAMDLIGLYGGPTRHPLLPVSDEAKKDLERMLREIG